MNRPFFSSACALALAANFASAATQDLWQNDGPLLSPPQEVPMIDAVTFVNNGLFFINNFLTDPLSTNFVPVIGDTLFVTANTLNYYNRNQMQANPGFQLDYYNTQTGRSGMAANFVNAGSVSDTNCSIYAANKLLVSATNIVNRGILSVGGGGLLQLHGENIDLDRGLLYIGGQAEDTTGIYDTLWGIDTNDIAGQWTPAGGTSYPMQATAFDGQNYQAFPFYVLNLANGYNAYFTITAGQSTDFNLDVLLLANDNPNIPAEVRFNTTANGAVKAVRWESIVADRLTGGLVTNHLYLRDTYPLVAEPEYITNFVVVGTAAVPWTMRPDNYEVTRQLPGFQNYTLMTPDALDPALFAGTNTPVTLGSAAYSASISVEPSRPNGISSVGYSNLTSRIELLADKVLNLNGARVQAGSFLMLKATNQVAGAENSQIFAPFSSMFLGTTNASLSISNFLSSTVPQITGDIQCWSGRWTNANPSGSVLYNVTMVHSALRSEVTSFVEDLHLTAPELVISDIMNVTHDLLLDCERLTITTNAPGAMTAAGELNLMQNQILWSPSLPRLQYFTNWGTVTTPNTAYFAGARTAPWFGNAFTEPYQALVNHGLLSSQGNRTWTRYFENSGQISSGVAGLDILADTAVMNDGALLATNGDLTVSGGALMVSNLVLNAGRAISLSANGYISDGSVEWPVSLVTNKNTWVDHNGFNLTTAPTHGSFLATSVSNIAYPYANVISTWAGVDRGKGPCAFVDNCAIGRLVLDGGNRSTFTFAPATGNNAIYVDRLELVDYAASQDSMGELKGVKILPGMKIYFGQALAGGVSVAEKLDGRNNGQFVWVSTYAGYYSSTNMIYPDGTTNKVNAALAMSCTIDSNGNGIVNCLDPAPILPGSNSDCMGTVVPPGGGTIGGGTGENGGANDLSAYLKLQAPAHNAPSGMTGFAGAKGAYYGLVYDEQNGVSLESSGYLTLVANKSRTFTAKLAIGGKVCNFSGRFAEDGSVTSLVHRKGLSDLTVSLQLDLQGSDEVTGQVTDGSWTSQIFGGKKAAPGALRGKYLTWRIPADPNNTAAPAGSGYGSMRVSASGTVLWKAVLADGTRISQSSALMANGSWPMYAAPYGGNGVILGWLDCDAASPSGDVIWIKSPNAGGANYNAGFSTRTATAGSAYSAPPRQRVLNLFNGYGKLVLNGAGISMPANSIHMMDNSLVENLGPANCTIKLAKGTGLFRGTIVHPTAGKISFSGTVLQQQNLGAGFFLTSDGQSGEVLLQSPGQ